MKGIVFVALAEMVQERYGFKAWNDLIESSNLESNGIYTNSMSYDDKEALILLEKISTKLNKSQSDVLKIFGIFLMKYFIKRYPQYFQTDDFISFMMLVEGKIHADLKIVSTESRPPLIKCKVIEEKKVISVIYKSDRKMCSLAIGLIKGASHHFLENIEIEHLKCMHDGHDECELLVRIK